MCVHWGLARGSATSPPAQGQWRRPPIQIRGRCGCCRVCGRLLRVRQPTDVRAALADLRQTHVASTCNHYRQALFSLYRALDAGDAPGPVRDVKPFPRPAPEPRGLSSLWARGAAASSARHPTTGRVPTAGLDKVIQLRSLRNLSFDAATATSARLIDHVAGGGAARGHTASYSSKARPCFLKKPDHVSNNATGDSESSPHDRGFIATEEAHVFVTLLQEDQITAHGLWKEIPER